MTASVSITTKYGQPCVCHPVAAPGAKSQRVIRTVASSCWTVGTAGSLHLKGMILLLSSPTARRPDQTSRLSFADPVAKPRQLRAGQRVVFRSTQVAVTIEVGDQRRREHGAQMIGQTLHRRLGGIGDAMRRVEQQDRIAFDTDVA